MSSKGWIAAFGAAVAVLAGMTTIALGGFGLWDRLTDRSTIDDITLKGMAGYQPGMTVESTSWNGDEFESTEYEFIFSITNRSPTHSATIDSLAPNINSLFVDPAWTAKPRTPAAGKLRVYDNIEALAEARESKESRARESEATPHEWPISVSPGETVYVKIESTFDVYHESDQIAFQTPQDMTLTVGPALGFEKIEDVLYCAFGDVTKHDRTIPIEVRSGDEARVVNLTEFTLLVSGCTVKDAAEIRKIAERWEEGERRADTGR